MKHVVVVIWALSIAVSAQAQRMQLSPSGSRPAVQGAAENFTGTVMVTPLFSAPEGNHATGGQVTFAAGARSAWHSHPAGQTLIMTSGLGWLQEWNGKKLEIRSGDVIWTPPGVKHWHGASATSAMTHIAIQENINGRNVDWLEQVSDQQYRASTPPSPGHEPQSAAPALERYRDSTIEGDLWVRPALSPRDRSLVTVAALIARGQTLEMSREFERALDHGVKSTELSEVITHLAFYSGWPNATAALQVANDTYTKRNIHVDNASQPLLRLDEVAEQERSARVEADFGGVAPGVVQYTRDLLFRELWLRPDLAPRDRSLITVSALVASGQVEQIPYHLNRAMDAGLKKAQASEMLTQLAFYAGWPNVFSALPVARGVFEKRSDR